MSEFTDPAYVPPQSPVTVNDALPSPQNNGSITQMFSWFGAMLRSITGKADWRTAPAINLQDASDQLALAGRVGLKNYGKDVAVGTTGSGELNITAATTDFLTIATGALSTITGAADQRVIVLRFTQSCTVSNSGNLVLPGSLTSYGFATGDVAHFRKDGSSWRLVGVMTANGIVLNANVISLAGLNGAANKMFYFAGSGSLVLIDLTAFARALLDDPSADAMLGTLGASTVGKALLALANPGSIAYPRIKADNTVEALSPSRYVEALTNYTTGTLSGDVTLTESSPRVHSVDPNGADRNYTLPAIAAATPGTNEVSPGWEVRITHIGTANVIVIKNAAGVEQARLSPGDRILFTARSSPGVWGADHEPANQTFVRAKGSVSLLSTGVVDLFTVPAGLTFVCTLAIWETTNAIGATSSTAQLAIVESGAGAAMTATLTLNASTNAAGKYERLAPASPGTVCASGNTVRLNRIAAGSGTQLDGIITVEGYFR